MTSTASRRPVKAFRQSPFILNPGAVSLAEGLRAGIAVALTVIAGALFGLPHFGLAALGALLACFADPGGPVARRAPAVLTFAVAAGLTYAGFGLLRGAGVWVAAPLAGLMIFGTSFARIYGQSGLQVGNLLTVVTVLALDQPAGWEQATAQGLNLAAGAGLGSAADAGDLADPPLRAGAPGPGRCRGAARRTGPGAGGTGARR